MTAAARVTAGRNTGQLVGLGLGLLLIWIAMVWVSRQFAFGPAFKDGPVALWIALCLAAWVPYLLAVQRARRAVSRGGLLAIIGIAAAMRLVALAGQPVLEDDYYRYLWDGHVVLQGRSPYARPPVDLPVAELEPDPGQRQSAEEVFGRINYPWVKTIYPPVAQAVFAGHAAVFGWQYRRFALTIGLLELLALLALWRLNQAAGLPPANILIYAWNPLLLTQVLNAWHFDILCVLWLALMGICVYRGRLGWAAAWLLVAGFTKLTPLVLAAPLFGLHWNRGRRCAAWRLAAGICATLAIAAAALLWSADAPLSGLFTFAADWQINGSVFPLLALALERSGLGLNPRWPLLLGYAALVWYVWRRTADSQTFSGAALLLLTAMFLIAPVGNPWYLTWLLPFLLLRPEPPILALMAVTSLYYAAIHFVYRDVSDGLYSGLLWLEYLPFYLFAGYWLWRRRQGAAEPEQGNEIVEGMGDDRR